MRLLLAKALFLIVLMIVFGAGCSGLAYLGCGPGTEVCKGVEFGAEPFATSQVIAVAFLLGAVIALIYAINDKDFRAASTVALFGRVIYRETPWSPPGVSGQARDGQSRAGAERPGKPIAPLFRRPTGRYPTPNTVGASLLVRSLMSDDHNIRSDAISQVMAMPPREALEAVESAICRLTGKEHVSLYTPGGMRAFDPQAAYGGVLELAWTRKMADDPAFTQSIIAGVAFLSDALMDELKKIEPRALTLYQLLGIQMQLSLQVNR